MADNQRIYPMTADVENDAGQYVNEKPSAPLAPNSSTRSSEKGGVDPVPVPPASNGRMRVRIPKEQVISRREHPRYLSPPPKRRCSCCRCLCCTICFLIAFVVIVAVACGVLYLVFRPKIPKYSVDSIQITNFTINPTDLSTNCQFAVKIKARNPNKRIGIYYLDNSNLAVLYSGSELCTGSLPVFYQGHQNTTFLDVELTGTGAKLTSDMVTTLKAQTNQASIPLNLKADVPVKIKLGKLKLWKITVRVRWDLTVNQLDANAKVTVKKSKVRVKL